MNDDDVSRELQRLVAFIKFDAEEKAREIAISAEEEFQLLKLQYVEAEMRKINQEYERKEKQLEIRRKIEYSMQLNACRLRVLQLQDHLVNDIKKGAEKQIYAFSTTDHYAYKQLMKDLIVQGALKLKESALLLRCRQLDLRLVKSVLQVARDQYAAKMKAHPPEVTIDEHTFLPPPAEETVESGPKCAGGVILASRNGRIVCNNTLDSRLEITFKHNLPEIQKRLVANIRTADKGA